MTNRLRIAALTALFVALPALAGEAPATRRDAAAQWASEGLQRVEIKGIQVAYARPGAALGGYREVAIAPIDVSFRRETDHSLRDPLRLRAEDEERIKPRLARLVREELATALGERGFTLVQDPRGARTLEVDASITDVHLTAPDVRLPGRVDVYARSAGEMTLVAGLRDGASGEPLLRVFDRAQTFETTFPHHVTVVESDAQLRAAAREWARALARELGRANAR
jgi:hypothetical protein